MNNSINIEKDYLKDTNILSNIIKEYINYTKENDNISSLCIELLYKYCNTKKCVLKLDEVDNIFFEEYIVYWLPKESRGLSNDVSKKILLSIKAFTIYCLDNYNYDIYNLYCSIYNKYKESLPRIMFVKKEFLRYLGEPIISWNPLVVDLNLYKMKKSKKEENNKDLFEQGHFEVLEVYKNNIILRRIREREIFIKLQVSNYLASYIREGDILHMRIKRKLFCSMWDIVEMKNCYLKESNKYI